MERIPITLHDTMNDIVTKLAEGNWGAWSVLMRILKQDPDFGVFSLLHLDDMNIRGAQIWCGFKDVCSENIEKFIEAIQSRDHGLVEAINSIPPVELGTTEKAVTHGWSFRRSGTL